MEPRVEPDAAQRLRLGWSKHSTDVLIDEVNARSDVLFSDKRDKESCDMRKQIWLEIAFALKLRCPDEIKRTAESCADKWYNQKRAIRARNLAAQTYNRGTGGGPLRPAANSSEFEAATAAITTAVTQQASYKGFDSGIDTGTRTLSNVASIPIPPLPPVDSIFARYDEVSDDGNDGNNQRATTSGIVPDRPRSAPIPLHKITTAKKIPVKRSKSEASEEKSDIMAAMSECFAAQRDLFVNMSGLVTEMREMIRELRAPKTDDSE